MRTESWMIQITPEDDGFHWELSRCADSVCESIDEGGAAVLSDAVYWARRALDPFIEEELR
jgi:hypothetical protein